MGGGSTSKSGAATTKNGLGSRASLEGDGQTRDANKGGARETPPDSGRHLGRKEGRKDARRNRKCYKEALLSIWQEVLLSVFKEGCAGFSFGKEGGRPLVRCSFIFPGLRHRSPGFFLGERASPPPFPGDQASRPLLPEKKRAARINQSPAAGHSAKTRGAAKTSPPSAPEGLPRGGPCWG